VERPSEIIVAGGGLAGAAFALEAARKGRDVVLLERTRGPQLKVCGDFLSVEAQRLLAALGVDPAALGAMPIDKLRLASGRKSVEAALPFSAMALSRLRLDEALLSAASRAGAQVIRGATISAMDVGDGFVTLRAGDRAFRAASAILATGKHDLRGHPRAREGQTTAFKMMLRPKGSPAGFAGRVQLFGFDHGFAGVAPVEGGGVSVCWMTTRDSLGLNGMDWRKQFEHIAKRTRAFETLLDAEPLADKPATVAGTPYGYLRREAIAPHVFAIGDQLAVLPSFTGDGVSIALLSGIMAARAYVAGETAGAFQAMFTRRVSGRFRWARSVDYLLTHRGARWFGVRAASVFPGMVAPLARRTRLQFAPN
jgi:flavin-dependent dehydrogenase